MTPVIPYSTSNIFLIPGSPFSARKDKSFTGCCTLKKPTKKMSCARDFILPLSASMRLFPHIRTYNLHCKPKFGKLSATGIDVAVEQPDTPIEEKDAGEASDIQSAESSNEESSIKSKRPRPSRKSEMPPVKDEDLIPGAIFTGKVRSIQPFGAFVDFGAFTDGLVHVSRLSDSYVKDVGTVVSVGQEVKVRLVEANTETGRISLTMRESDDSNKLKDSPADGEKTRPPRRNTQKSNQKRDEAKKTTKFVKGQDLEGTVKNLTRSGAFISLPEGEEGFLPTSEEADEGFGNMMGETSLEVGQEVKVRVLRITRGQVTLTMKKEEDTGALNSTFQGVVHTATNPFLLAFRKNKDIAAFLDEKEKEENTISVVDGKGEQDEVSQAEVDEEPEIVVSDSLESVATSVKSIEEEDQGVVEEPETVVSDSLETVDNAVQSIEEETPEVVESEITVSDSLGSVSTAVQSIEERSQVVLDEPESVVSDPVESVDTEARSLEEETQEVIEDPENVVSSSLESVDTAAESIKEEAQEVIKDPETAVSDSVESMDTAAESIGEETQEVVEDPENVISSSVESEDTAAQIVEEEIQEVVEDPKVVSDSLESLDSKEQSIETETQEVVEVKSEGEPDEIIVDVVETPTPSSEDEISSPSVEEEKLEAQMQTPGNENEISSSTTVIEKSVEPDSDEGSSITSGEQVQISVEENDVSSLAPVEDEPSLDDNIGIISSTEETNVSLSKEFSTEETQVDEIVEPQDVEVTTEKNGSITNLNGQNGAPSAGNTTKATISPALVKQLREETGAGMMDCKKALSETGGDLVKAQEFLRKKGLASADKKASRATAEGRIGSYVHDSRIGVLLEVNCETDFVSRGDIFKELVNDLAMQVAACPQVEYLVTEDVPQEIVEKEKEIEMQKEDLASKPEQIRSKIVEGRIRKRLEELALLEQPYIKNDKVVVKDLVKQTIATIGENIKVKRFVRFNLGEGLEKKSQDFAAEVAAQTSAKPVAAPEKEPPATVETKETDEKPAAKAVISAALVKQLREETGAGMMDCKKALSETGGDLQMAQEYLRKKGLSSADKKSGRLAAEGRIGSYIHDSRIGVLIEVNCETDFVGRSEKFRELVDDLAMQVVACPAVQYVSVEDIPESIVTKEKELEMQREDILSKPENIRERIVDGRVSKRLGELTLLEQPFIKDDNVLVKDLVKQTIAAIGENIKVRRFVRFTLGEETDAKTETEA